MLTNSAHGSNGGWGGVKVDPSYKEMGQMLNILVGLCNILQADILFR